MSSTDRGAGPIPAIPMRAARTGKRSKHGSPAPRTPKGPAQAGANSTSDPTLDEAFFAYPDPDDISCDDTSSEDTTSDGSAIAVPFDDTAVVDPSGTPATDGPPRAPGRRRGWRGIRRADGLIEPIRLLAELALEPLLPTTLRRALSRADPLVIVLKVPSAAWVKPSEDVLRLASGGQARIMSRTVRVRSTTEAELDTEAVERIESGRPIVAITPDLGYIAPVLLAAADHRLVVTPLDAVLVTRAVQLWCGRKPRVGLDPTDMAGLDLFDVAAALRVNASPAQCIARIQRASRARVEVPAVDAAIPPLDQLAGYGDALVWARRTVADIARVRRRDSGIDATMLESIVWFGPPGTGKTTLARAMAAAAGVTCIETSVARWFVDGPGYLDSVLKQITAFTERLELAAQRDGTAIGFIDELDALPSRTRLDARNASFWTPAILHVLTCTERLRRAGVVLIAATNHLETIDSALLRPGRFDRQIWIGPPDETGRVCILRAQLGPDLREADLTQAARLSVGATGAVLAGHVRGARARARSMGRPLHLDDLLIEIAPPDPRSAAELAMTALHEAGHALAAFRQGLPVEEVSIQASQGYGGLTVVRLTDRLPNRPELERRVIGLLAGRAAEVVLGTGATVGAASDLREATRQLAALHASFGLGDTLSTLAEPEHAGALLRTDPVLAKRVEADLGRLQAVAQQMVRADWAAIRALAKALLAQRVLNGGEIAAIAAAHPPKPAVPPGHPPNTDPPAKG